ncbi:hypothetical protein SK128_021497 [Halocaridina rubra]|uniref:Uncharacterized protein n=1 Tax=Halocaridina rubra TaxID=373956 RepID=A0AAN8X443_HALRR
MFRSSCPCKRKIVESAFIETTNKFNISKASDGILWKAEHLTLAAWVSACLSSRSGTRRGRTLCQPTAFYRVLAAAEIMRGWFCPMQFQEHPDSLHGKPRF